MIWGYVRALAAQYTVFTLCLQVLRAGGPGLCRAIAPYPRQDALRRPWCR
jgi:hypothetical protein